jgi:serine phosphatase RsbU (regulator of sigma subunit)
VIQKNRNLPVKELLVAIQQDVQQFDTDHQGDDITLIVARCH